MDRQAKKLSILENLGASKGGTLGMIPFRLEYVIEQTFRLTRTANGSRERRVIRDLTGLRVPESQAREVLSSILLHKWYLGERLNRDVGLRTAAVDYLENIAPPS